MKTTPRVWVGLEGSYSAGRLVGEWVDADTLDEDGVAALLGRLQAADPEGGEEMSIMDEEGWGSIKPNAFPLHELAAVAELMDEVGPALHAYINHVGTHYHHDADSLRDGFDSVTVYGPYDSIAAFGEEYAEGIEVPEALQYYIDWERLGEDAAMDGSQVRVDGDLYVVFG